MSNYPYQSDGGGNCSQCQKACPEHGVTFCGTCHHHKGECDMGGCFEASKSIVNVFRTDGSHAETREACSDCAAIMVARNGMQFPSTITAL